MFLNENGQPTQNIIINSKLNSGHNLGKIQYVTIQ